MNILVIYVGKKSENNLCHGLFNNIWGFKESIIGELKNQRIKENYVLIGHGFSKGSPRKSEEEWKRGKLEVIYFGKITSEFYYDEIPEWEDEKLMEKEKRYVWRFKFDLVKEMNNIKNNILNEDIMLSIRKSSIAQSRGYLLTNISNIFLKEEKKYDNLNTISEVEMSYNSSLYQSVERDSLIKSRIGQNIFRKKLLKIHKKCLICGIDDKRFLVASHIKPWSKGTTHEKLDVYNGFLFCKSHDSLFDQNLISFRDDGSIIISKTISEEVLEKLNTNKNQKLQIPLEKKTIEYLKYHREKLI